MKGNPEKAEIGGYRIVPKGTIIWSIPHQTTLITNGDELVKITHTTQSSSVFVEPSQEIFNFGPFIHR